MVQKTSNSDGIFFYLSLNFLMKSLHLVLLCVPDFLLKSFCRKSLGRVLLGTPSWSERIWLASLCTKGNGQRWRFPGLFRRVRRRNGQVLVSYVSHCCFHRSITASAKPFRFLEKPSVHLLVTRRQD